MEVRSGERRIGEVVAVVDGMVSLIAAAQQDEKCHDCSHYLCRGIISSCGWSSVVVDGGCAEPQSALVMK